MKNHETRLLIITSNFAPELTGIGKYVSEMTEGMASAGVAIRVITTPPYYPAWAVGPGYSAARYSTESLAGAQVVRCPLWVPRQPRGAGRILHTLSFALSSLPAMLWQALTWRPHVVMVIEPPLLCAPGARLAAWLCGARSWLHVQDFEVDAAFDLGLVKGGWLRSRALAAEKWLMRSFDHVSSISPRMLRKLRDKEVEGRRIGFFPNWVDTAEIRPLADDNALRSELAIPTGTAVLLYSGNLGEKQGLELLVTVARDFAASEKDVLFLICGDGVAKERVMKAAAGLDNIRFLPLQPSSRFNELLNLAAVHLLPQRADAEDLVMPSKLTAMLASGRPVVASARAGSDVAQAATAGGLVVPPGDAAAFGTALRQLLGDAALRGSLGRSGRTYAVAHWDRHSVIAEALRGLETLLDRSSWHKSDTSSH